MRKRGEAVFTLSDAFGRECVTGVAKQMLSVADANMDVSVLARRSVATDSLGGYEIMNNAITLPSDNLLSVTYYDDYSFLTEKRSAKSWPTAMPRVTTAAMSALTIPHFLPKGF